MKTQFNSNDLTVLTLVVFLLLIYKITSIHYFINASLIIGVLGVLFPVFSKYVHLIWMGFAVYLNKLVTPLILSLLYFCILTPLALLSRLINTKDTLFFKNNSTTTFTNCTHNFNANFFEKLW